MKKILALILVAFTLALTTGCNPFGSDGDDGTTLPGTSSVPNSVNVGLIVPASSLANGNLRAAANATNLVAYIFYNDVMKALERRVQTNGDVHFFLTGLDARYIRVSSANSRIIILLSDGTSAVEFETVPLTVSSSSTVAQTVAAIGQIVFTTQGSLNGVTVIPVTLTNPTTGFATGGIVVTGATFGNPITVTVTEVSGGTSFAALSVDATGAGTNFESLSPYAETPSVLGVANLENVMFKAAFPAALDADANLRFSVTVDNVMTATPSGVTITQADGGLVVTVAPDRTSITARINTSVPLIGSGLYKITFNSFSGTVGGKAFTVSGREVYFIMGTRLTQWSINGVNGNDVTPATNVPVQGATAGKTTIVLTFSGNVVEPTVGSVKLERFASSTVATAETTMSWTVGGEGLNIQVSGNTMTLVFDNTFLAGKFYKVSYLSGGILDGNGFPVEIHSAIPFTTAN